MRFAVIIALVSIVTTSAHAENFQMIWKLTKANAPMGFIVGKRETLPNKNMRWTTFLALKSDGLTQVTSVEVDAALRPSAINVVRKAGGVAKFVKGTIKGDTFSVSIKTESTANPGVAATSNVEVKVPSPNYWFLFVPDALKSRGLLKAGAKSTFLALVEDPGTMVLDVSVGNDEVIGGIKTHPVALASKDLLFNVKLWVTDDLEPVRIEIEGLRGELVSSLSEASQGMSINETDVSTQLGGPVKSEHKLKLAPAQPKK